MSTLSEKVAYLIVFLGAVLWGTTGTAQSFIPTTVDPLVVAALRLAISGFSLLFIITVLGKMKLTNWAWSATMMAAVSLALFQYFFFSSVRLTGVAIGTVISVGSAPLFAGIIEMILRKKAPTWKWGIATFLSILGCSILFLNSGLVVLNTTGILVGLVAGLSFALYTIFNKVVVKNVSVIIAIAVVFTISAVMLMPFIFLFESNGIMTKSGIISILYIGLVTTSIGYFLYSLGLKKIPSSSATTLALTEPLIATLLGVFVVGEYLSLTAWSGVAFLISGILILTFSKKTDQKV